MIEHPYAAFLKNVERPGRYLGGEFGAATPTTDAEIHMALSYPDTYEIGMSHIGLRVLYEIVNKMPGVSCERVFMPWTDMIEELRDRHLPLVTLEGAVPLYALDMLGISLQYELTYTNIITMLDLGQIPRRADKRTGDHPLILVGGPAACHAEPLSPFVDLALIGDGEEALPALIEALRQAKSEGLGRQETVGRLGELPFIAAPNTLSRRKDAPSGRRVVDSEKRPIAAWAKVSNLNAYPAGESPDPTIEAVFDRFSLEIARGCAGGCRFCQAGFLYRPVRERTVDNAKAAIDRAVNCMGFDGVSLASLSTADHSQIEPMLLAFGDHYTAKRVSFFVPSLRAYGLKERLVEIVSRLRATGVTLAPEAGSQRLRDVINKNITEQDLICAAARFFDWGAMRIKLYFMLGLPTETDDDLREIIALAKKVKNFGRSRLGGRTPTVTVSVSTFVPKPFTPFERESMINADEIKRRQALLMDLGRQARLEVRTHATALSILEGILCRGDQDLSAVLEKAVDNGACFDGWSEKYNHEAWADALRMVNIEAQLGPIPAESPLPWQHIEAGVDTGFLAKETKRATTAVTTAPCGRFKNLEEGRERFVCHHCGLACERADVPLRAEPYPGQIENLPPPKKIKGNPRPRAADEETGEAPIRIMLYVAKWGRQAFVGHLDTVRHVMRSLRRAGLEIYYTKGFHPKPKIITSPPLPLGVSAMEEPMEVFLVNPPKVDEILKRLAMSVPDDLRFVRAEVVPPSTKGLGKRIESADYVATVPSEKNRVAQSIEKMLASKALPVIREKKGKTKSLDIRPFIISAALLDSLPPGAPIPDDKDRTAITFSLYLPGTGGARVAEVLTAIFGDDADDAWVARTKLHIER